MDSVLFQAIRLLPRRQLTRLLGSLAAMQVPAAARATLYGAFASAVGAKPEEAESPMASYDSFDAFFTRRLKPGLRPWSAAEQGAGMPCDGRLDQLGRVRDGKLIQAKGMEFGPQGLLGTENPIPWANDAWFVTIYLSPADYHRVHMPASGRVTELRRMGGELWPVNALSVRQVDRLFEVNERLSAQFTLADGRRAAMVMVAATVVGGIGLAPPLPPVEGAGAIWQSPDAPISLGANDEFGTFHIGSTVVMMFEDAEQLWEPAPGAVVGEKVRLGEPLFRLRASL
jgi:phosphatidylserine decarboxylase